MVDEILIITGKGGVGKTTIASFIALLINLYGNLDLTKLLKEFNSESVSLVSIDPMHSLADSFGLNKPYQPNPLKNNKSVNLWSMEPWKSFLKKNNIKGIQDLLLKRVVPTGVYLPNIKNALINDLYTEYELLVEKEITHSKTKTLIIDTDSLEGLQRLLNYANESEKLGQALKSKAKLVFVTTPEPVTMAKVLRIIDEPLVSDYAVNGLEFVINRVNSDESLKSLPNWLTDNALILYEQSTEPVGLDLLKLTSKPENIINNKPVIKNDYLPLIAHKKILIGGKGGQGKSTIACAIAVRLAEKGYKVVLVSADARSSLSDLLDEPIGYETPNSGLTRLSLTEQYKGLRIAVMKGSKYFDEVPGVPFMKALMRMNYQAGSDTYLIIDAPPSGNIIKNFNKALPSDSLAELLYRFDLWQLGKRGKTGAKQFLIDRREAFVKGAELMSTPAFYAVPVMQPTMTALNETNRLISELYTLNAYPYNPHELLGEPLLHEGLFYGYRKSVVINRYDKASQEFINHLRNNEFPPEMYNLAFVPSITNPRGRKALSLIGCQLIG